MEKDLIEYIAKSLVNDPSSVSVQEVEGEKSTVIELRVAQSDNIHLQKIVQLH